ncbi:MAG: Ku protein [Gammaproteobacteria bacterium]|nr:Ku protein [Gammaproteobacteria bacterium]
MRPIWKGQISFGLINIPVELYSAAKKTDLQFKLLDSRNKAKVRYERVNEKTGRDVPWSEIVKAYEVDKKNYVILEEEDFKNAAIENTQTFEIEDFIDRKSLDCTYFEKPYYLVPTQRSEKGYVLLREVLKKKEEVAIGKVIIRTRQYLAALLPHDDVLMLNILRFAEELRDTTGLNVPKGGIKEYKITAKEVEMAEKLVESMTVKWNPKKYHDNYRDALMAWIKKKAKHGHIPMPAKQEEEGKSAEIVDFMELLKKSIKKKVSKEKKDGVKTTAKRKALK